MLVEDEDPVRIFAARALRNKGYKVLEAKSGEAALDLIRDADETIDLLVTDVVMPRMDGPTLVRQVREIHPDMKVIFISGYAEDAFRKRLDSDAEIHFLPKPFTLKQLAGKVKEAISGEAEGSSVRAGALINERTLRSADTARSSRARPVSIRTLGRSETPSSPAR